MTAIFFDLFNDDRKYDNDVPRIPPPIITTSKSCAKNFQC